MLGSSRRRCRSTASASCWPGSSRPTAGSSPRRSPRCCPASSSSPRTSATAWWPSRGDHARDVSDGAIWLLAGGTTLGVVVLSLPLLVPGAAHRRRGCGRPFTFPAGVARRAGSLAGAGVLALVAQQAAVAVDPLAHPRTAHRRTSVSSTSTPTSRPSTCCRMPCWPSRSRPRPSRRWRHGAASRARRPGSSRARHPGSRPAGDRPAHRRRCRRADGRLPARRGLLRRPSTAAADAGGGAALAALPGALSAYAPGPRGLRASRPCSPARCTSADARSHAALAVAAGWALAALLPLPLIPDGSGAGHHARASSASARPSG